ncbi:MAG TPA: GDP-L-fucose synthase [candidate division Zixibacteria bacterium]|nr:GDP-L-fucose synthase [candidate division Zixibacteria bacterium]
MNVVIEEKSKIYVAGGDTLVGASLLAELERRGYRRIVNRSVPEPDLADPAETDEFFRTTLPELVFVAAGKSGGIEANRKYPASLMADNLLVATNVIRAAHRHGVRKLLYLASSCVYPRLCPQPMEVGSLMTGPLEPTNEAYAAAKLAGLILCRAYRVEHGVNFVTLIPANPFGPGDDFSLEGSHVIAALMRRMHAAKIRGESTVRVWGSGRPRREFIFARDLADACIFVMQRYEDDEPINVGVGSDLSIAELAELVRETVGYRGRLEFDPGQPDGMPAKLLDSSRLRAMGWRPQTPLKTALAETYEWFCKAAEKEHGDRAFL